MLAHLEGREQKDGGDCLERNMINGGRRSFCEGSWDEGTGKIDNMGSCTEKIYRLHFFLTSVYDVFPSPTNLFGDIRRHMFQSHCKGSATFEHIIISPLLFLNSLKYLSKPCKTVDTHADMAKVLLILADCLETVRRRQNVRSKGQS